jgi:hypothetical protein
VDARARNPASTAGESVVHPASASAAYQGLLYVEEGAAGTSIRGLRLQNTGGSDQAGGAGIYTQSRGSDGGYTFAENVITGNVIGMLLHSSGAPTTVTRNLFFANTRQPDLSAAGNGIYSERAQNVTVADNRFENNTQTGVFTVSGGNVDFTGNQSVGEFGGVVLVSLTGVRVSGNTFSGGERTGIALGGDRLDGAQVTDNVITGRSGTRANGIRLLQFGSGQNRDVTIARNTITGISSDDEGHGNGIFIGDKGADGTVAVHNNRIVGTSGAGLRNEDGDATVDARRNWWGCNDGPGFGGCETVVSPDGTSPAYSPWLTLSLAVSPTAAARARAAQIPAGGSATATARLANLSLGGLASGPFFSTATAAFSASPTGTFAPASAPLPGDDLTASSAFTAAAAPERLSVTVDRQTVSVLNSDPPAPDVEPSVTPDDATLAPGQNTKILVRLVNRGNRTARRLQACLKLSGKLRRSGARCRRFATLPAGRALAYHIRSRARTDVCGGRLASRLRLKVAGQPVKVRRMLGRLLAARCAALRCPASASAQPSRLPGRAASDRRRARREVRARAAC